jgi:Flp pilus assembly protein TadG
MMRRRNDRGTVLVEAAIIMPVLILLAMGTIEFGMAWRDRLSVQNASRAGARAGASLATDAQTDYNILQSVKSGLGTKHTSATKIIVYKATASDGAVPAACLSASQSGVCNVYTVADMSAASTDFGCGAGDKDTSWCPTSRSADVTSANGPDYVGVYIAFSHGMITGSFGSGTLTIRDSAVMRLEPQ